MPTEKLSVTLYNGKINIDFYPSSHRYKFPTERYYLVSATAATGVLDKSRFLLPWAVAMDLNYIRSYLERIDGKFTKEELMPVINEASIQHTLKKEEAADIGTEVHAWIESFISSKLDKTDCPGVDTENEKVQNGIMGFLDWYNSHKVEFTASERLIYSKKHDYCGLTDFTAIVNGKNCVGDFKTGKDIYTEHHYQLSGYWKAIEEEDGKEFDHGIILHCNKETGEFKTVEISKEDNNLNFDVFLACLTIKKREKVLSR